MKLRKIPGLISGLFLILAVTACRNTDQDMNSRFHGMWKLLKIESFDQQGGQWSSDPFFEGWNGYIYNVTFF